MLELKEGFDALADRRAGQRTLRTHTVKIKRAPTIAARELATVRKDMNLSRGLVAGYLRTNVRTLENWEQGVAALNRTRRPEVLGIGAWKRSERRRERALG